jgi:sialate O-acetylesterase
MSAAAARTFAGKINPTPLEVLIARLRRRVRRRVVPLLAALLGVASPLLGRPVPHPLFGDHAVLQQQAVLPVWGTADPGEAITVRLAGHERTTTADAAGKWIVRFDPIEKGGPHELTVIGTETVVARDVLIGEVWLCSGQSNMDFTVQRTEQRRWSGLRDADAVIAAANEPQVREFKVRTKLSDDPQATVEGQWVVCSPQTVGDFSAVAYFFGRDLHRELNTPVGLITSAFGASTAQAWTSRSALAEEPSLAEMLSTYDQARQRFESGESQKQYEQRLKEWEAASTQAVAENKPAPRKPGAPRHPNTDQHNPAVLYNGMIAPLAPYALRGAIWYQGESNGYNNELYLTLMKTLIADWRSAWGSELPFLFVQLANYKPPATQPVDRSQIASVREAQRLTLAVPKTAMAVTVDIGEANDIHPRNKLDVGRRLALAARATVYGQDVVHSGPLFASAVREGSSVRVRFAPGTDQLTTRDNQPLVGFSLRDAEGGWHWADAAIENGSVRVSSPHVTNPVEVRYAFADNPPANLYNAAGLPASPFRAALDEPGR